MADLGLAIKESVADDDYLLDQGTIDLDTETQLPAAEKGHRWRIIGTSNTNALGMANPLSAGDIVECLVDGTAAGVPTNWSLVEASPTDFVSKANGGTFEGDIFVSKAGDALVRVASTDNSNVIVRLDGQQPRVDVHDLTGASTDARQTRIVQSDDEFRLQALNDADVAQRNLLRVSHAGGIAAGGATSGPQEADSVNAGRYYIDAVDIDTIFARLTEVVPKATGGTFNGDVNVAHTGAVSATIGSNDNSLVSLFLSGATPRTVYYDRSSGFTNARRSQVIQANNELKIQALNDVGVSQRDLVAFNHAGHATFVDRVICTAMRMEGIFPVLDWYDTDGTADERRWRASTSSADGALFIESTMDDLTRRHVLFGLYHDGGVTCGTPVGASKGFGTINCEAGLYQNNVAVQLVSDERLKDDITSMAVDWSGVEAVAGAASQWQWKDSQAHAGEPEEGFVAQRLEEAGFPQWVITDKPGEPQERKRIDKAAMPMLAHAFLALTDINKRLIALETA